MDALENEYFKFAVIGLYEISDPDNLFECYKFSLQDTTVNGKPMFSGKTKNLRHQAYQTMKDLCDAFLKMPSLPDEYNITFRIVYNSRTPKDYMVSISLLFIPCVENFYKFLIFIENQI